MAKKKLRTAAERSAAAKASWARRKAAKTSNTQLEVLTAPTTARMVREGSDIFVTFSHEGSLFRHCISPSTVKALMLDAIGLVHA